MTFIKYDMQDESMKMALLPLYQTYEAEISNEKLEDIFPTNAFDKNFEYFTAYFEGKTTYICIINGKYKGFVTFHIDCEDTPGYASGYEGWGHISELYIDRQLRKQGLGKSMVKRAEEELKKIDVTSLYLMNLLQENTNFWVSLGYIDTGKIVPEEGGRIFEKQLISSCILFDK